MQIDSEDVPAAHMHPVLSDAPKSGELLDSCPIAGSNADAAEGHYSPAVIAALLFAFLREFPQRVCDYAITLEA